MPRQVAVSAENNFSKGLITETTALNFPENAATETYDCIFNQIGEVTRRPGFDLEPSYTLYTATIPTVQTSEVFTEYLWQAVSGDGDINFLVQQQGDKIHFYDVSSSTSSVSDNKKTFTVDLDSFLATSSGLNPAERQCSFASGNGDLIVVNPACDPFFVSYDVNAVTVTSTEITLKYRDFTGLDDGLSVFERPTTTVANLITSNPEHYYNLLNQGWNSSDALAQWDTALTNVPSNADYIALCRASETDSFDVSRVSGNQAFSNRPAPKGHFILDVGNADREQALDDEGFTATLPGTVTDITSSGTAIGSMIGPANAFDGSMGSAATWTGTTGVHVGKTLSAPAQVHHITFRGEATVGFGATSNPNYTFNLYAKNGAAPSNSTDGTSLATTSTGDGNGIITLTSSDQTTFYDHVWLRAIASANDSHGIYEMTIHKISYADFSFDSSVTPERPSTVAFAGGRIFYAGINANDLNGNIYFSQVIENSGQYGKCYQENDPTDEFFSDLLPDDGGIVRIPEIGNVKKIFAYQSSILIYATNGVWMISGSRGSPFAANDYVVRKLSSLGTVSNLSFVDIRGVPVWWAEDGIFTIKFDPNYDSFDVKSITDDTIKTFVLSIPTYNRRFVKGAYDILNDTAYWIYNDGEDLDVADTYVYNAAVVMNGLSGSFYPWTIGEGVPQVRGISYVADTSGTGTEQIKYTTTIPIDASSESLTYSGCYNDSYKDWSSYVTISGDSDDEIDYTSYFITGYKIHADGTRFFQPQYVFFYLQQQDDASAYMQAIYDFTTTGNTGKWSSKQQIYNSDLLDRGVNYRRLKVRGKGRAMQFRVNSESGKPFTLIGWASRESAGQTV